jgi:hypothetical protein
VSEHWRTRGFGVSKWLWPALRCCPRLRWAAFWLLHRFYLAYWLKGEDGKWRRVA